MQLDKFAMIPRVLTEPAGGRAVAEEPRAQKKLAGQGTVVGQMIHPSSADLTLPE